MDLSNYNFNKANLDKLDSTIEWLKLECERTPEDTVMRSLLSFARYLHVRVSDQQGELVSGVQGG